MPTVKIELLIGRDRPTLIKIRDSVMDSVVDTLQLPADDRNVRLIEYQPELFLMKPPYEILIEISLFAGRTKETKRKLFQTIVDKLESNELIDKEKILITLNEQPLENWGGRGGIPADEMDLGFKVKI
ncbi:MAG: tautomerase family protein [Sulfuricella sp.]|nr:tautomerase family protein [Sulfuricella sp.]